MPTAAELLKSKSNNAIYTCRPESSIQDACRLMERHRVGCLIVSHGTTIDGIITERDIVNKLVAVDLDASDTKVEALMTKKVVIVEPTRQIEEIEAIMRDMRIRHVPVAGEKELLGVLSIGDVMAWHAAKSKQEVHYLQEFIYGRG